MDTKCNYPPDEGKPSRNWVEYTTTADLGDPEKQYALRKAAHPEFFPEPTYWDYLRRVHPEAFRDGKTPGEES